MSPARFAVLAPATVPSREEECSQQLVVGNDGSAGPLFCPDDDLNTLAWQYYAGLPVMGLGREATSGQVFAAMCTFTPVADGSSSIQVQIAAYDLAVDYYGWSFSVDLAHLLLYGGCGSPSAAPTGS